MLDSRLPIIFELLGVIRDLDALLIAEKLIVSALVNILKTSPATDLVNQDMIEIGLSG